MLQPSFSIRLRLSKSIALLAFLLSFLGFAQTNQKRSSLEFALLD